MPVEKRIAREAIILKVSPTGERFLQVYLLCSEVGLISLLKRNSSKTNRINIDLFDQGEAIYDHKPSSGLNAGFLSDFVVSKKRTGLGKSYLALKWASWISALIIRNPLHSESDDSVFNIAERVFDALSDGAPPQATTLKLLYVFSRDEGYPVLEDWVQNLKPDLSTSVAQLINTPLAQIDIPTEIQENALNSLISYVEQNTHISIPHI